MPTFEIKITGKVQGVFFRKSAREKALSLNLTGQVWNNDDGSVGLVVSGNNDQVAEFIQWCHRGPDRARVQSVEINEQPDRSFPGFNITR